MQVSKSESFAGNPDKDIEELRTRYDKLALEVCQLFDEDIHRDIVKKSKIIEWATTLENLMIKTGQDENIHLICSFLANHVRKQGFSIGCEKYIYKCLKEFPDFHLNYSKFRKQVEQNNGITDFCSRAIGNSNNVTVDSYRQSVSKDTDLPEECSITNVEIQEALETLKRIDISNMDRNQSSLFVEKLTEIQEQKLKEADSQGIKIYNATEQELNELDENAKNAEQYEERISVPVDQSIPEEVRHEQQDIKDRLLKIADIFTKWANVELDKHPVWFKEARDEICENLDAFIDFFVPTVDNKHRYSQDDWTNITFAWDDLSTFSTERLYPKLSCFCRHCKEHDYHLDPDEIKGLQIPVMMQPVLNPNRTKQNPYPYIWVCPSCKGTDAIEVEITRERAQDNLAIARAKTFNFINKFPLAAASLVYYHEWVQRYRLGETVVLSKKLESSK